MTQQKPTVVLVHGAFAESAEAVSSGRTAVAR